MKANSIFLRAKHWQIFVPLIAVPFVVMMIFSIITTVIMIQKDPQRPEDIIWIFYFMPLLMAVSGFVQFAWFWSILTKLGKLIPAHVQMPSGRIKAFFIIPIVYLCLILPFFIVFVINNMNRMEHGDSSGIIGVAALGILLFFLHLFSVFCLLHTLYFVAKTIRVAELQTNTTFSGFIGDFFLTWFLPIGIWFLQPRINRLIEQESEIGSNETLLDH